MRPGCRWEPRGPIEALHAARMLFTTPRKDPAPAPGTGGGAARTDGPSRGTEQPRGPPRERTAGPSTPRSELVLLLVRTAIAEEIEATPLASSERAGSLVPSPRTPGRALAAAGRAHARGGRPDAGCARRRAAARAQKPSATGWLCAAHARDGGRTAAALRGGGGRRRRRSGGGGAGTGRKMADRFSRFNEDRDFQVTAAASRAGRAVCGGSGSRQAARSSRGLKRRAGGEQKEREERDGGVGGQGGGGGRRDGNGRERTGNGSWGTGGS